jgi:(heptosyl)LPS beta-1,4-glucosyltransferase
VQVQLTVLIPCKNEEQNIVACVEAARPVADEILIADSGSTDRTLDLVRRLKGCRLIEREFVSYPSFKNWAIPQARHEWVLIVDADERVTPDLAAEIRQTLAGAPDQVDGYWIGRNNFFMGHPVKYSGWQNDRVFRLIRRDVCRYRDCRVHEGIDVRPERAGKLMERFEHYVCWTYDHFLVKQLKYVKLGALDRWEAGRHTSHLRMLCGPLFRFAHLYLLHGGWRDGILGLQICYLQALVTFLKEARLWEHEHALPQPLEPLLEELNEDTLARAA